MSKTAKALEVIDKDSVNIEDDEIRAKYFNGNKKATVRRKARAGTLGVPAYQPIEINGWPWLVKIADLEKKFGRF